jgi:DNA-binding NarL/FixJ family response regulator
MQKYKVLIVDDHRLFCEGLRQLLKFQEHLQVVGVAHDPGAAITAVQQYKPDIVLLDVEMPGGSGLELLRYLKSILPNLRILMLTMHTEEGYLIRALEYGAFGYILKDSPSEELFSMIDSAIRGEAKLEYKTIKRMTRELASKKGKELNGVNAGLTVREAEVLRLVAKGYTNKKVAENLGVSGCTVKNHLAKIYEKLNCSNRTEAVLAIRQRGFTSED